MFKACVFKTSENNSHRKKILHLTLFIILIFACPPNLYAGKIIEQPALECYLGIPKSSPSTSSKPMPVLVVLPGWGVMAKSDINLWAFPADKRGFLLIELNVNYSGVSTTQLYSRIQNIIGSLLESYHIDKGKMFIAGTSAGGMMAMALALSHPREFKAVGVVSGARFSFGAEKFLKNAAGQLFYLYHGRNDKTISIGEFYYTKSQLEEQGAVIESKVIPEGGHTLPSSCYKEVVDRFYQISELIP